MIGAAELVNGIWMGTVLFALGMFPALFENVIVSLRKFANQFSPAPIPSRWQKQSQPVPLKQQPWLAALGAAVSAATVILYFVG